MSQSEQQARAQFVHSDGSRWLSEVRKSLKQEAEALGAPAKVFDVPRVLRATKPEAYLPQHFALGPYHCHRAELRDMERYKLAAAKRAEKLFADGKKFEDLAQQLHELGDKIRAPYHRSLELEDEPLAWMMAIDTCFLLDFLEGYHRKEATDMVSSATTWIDAMVRDAMMLENQLPLFVFAQALALRHASQQAAEEALYGVLDRFIREVSPIKTSEEQAVGDVCRHAHMLELLYHFLVPSAAVFDEDCRDPPPIFPYESTIDMPSDQPAQHFPDKDTVKKACEQVSSLITRLTSLLVRKVPVLSPLARAGKVLDKMTTSPTLKVLEDKIVNQSSIQKSRRAEEIMIPSVSQLAGWGVTFAPAPEGIAGIAFDADTATLSLPVITLDGNTEVVLRNLVAYEAVTVRGPLVLARYTELMNGIVDTPKDVKILRKAKVVKNQLKSDKEAADMWNGMCRATRLSKANPLDDAIRGVNQYEKTRAAARAQKLFKKYVFKSWRVLTLLAALVLLLMIAMQTFCSVYPCHGSLGPVFQLPNPEGSL